MVEPTPAPPMPPRDEKVRMPGQAEAQPVHPEEVRKRNLADLGMLALGVASLGIVAYDFLHGRTLPPGDRFLLEVADLGIVLVFAAEFAWRWRKADRKGRFVLQNWFDLLGMVPMMATNIPLFRAFRLLRIGMVAARLFRMWSFITGEKSAQLVLNRYRAALVEEVTDRVLVDVVDTVERVAAKGGYVRALGDSLHQQREDIAAAAVKGAKADGAGKLVALVPGAEAAVREAALAAVDSVVATLRSPEMQRTFEVAIRNVVAEARAELRKKDWQAQRPAGRGWLGRRGEGSPPGDSEAAGAPRRVAPGAPARPPARAAKGL